MPSSGGRSRRTHHFRAHSVSPSGRHTVGARARDERRSVSTQTSTLRTLTEPTAGARERDPPRTTTRTSVGGSLIDTQDRSGRERRTAMVDEGWTTVEKKTPKEAASGGRGGGAGANKERARGSGARGDPRRARPRACPSLFFSLPTAATVRKPSFARGARSDALAPAPPRSSPLAPLATRVRPPTIPTFDLRPDPHPFPRRQQARGMPRADPPITTAVPAAGSPVDGTTTRASPAATATAAATPRTPPAATPRAMPRATTPPTPVSLAAPPAGAASPAARAVATAAAASVASAARTSPASPPRTSTRSRRPSSGPRLAKARSRRSSPPPPSAPAPPRSPPSSSRAAAAASGRRRWSSTQP